MRNPLILVLLLGGVQLFSQNEPTRNLYGTVYDEELKPFSGVQVTRKGYSEKTKTDGEGSFTIKVKANDTLDFHKDGYLPKRTIVGNTTLQVVYMRVEPKFEDQRRSKPADGALGMKKDPNSIVYAYQTVNSEDLNIGRSSNVLEALDSKVSGLILTDKRLPPNATPADRAKATKEIQLRGVRFLQSTNSALVVVDGIPSTYQHFVSLDPTNIESVTILKGANAAVLYGSQAGNGVVMVKTKKSVQTGRKDTYVPNYSAETFYFKTPKVDLKEKAPDFLGKLEKAASMDEASTIYTNYSPKKNEVTSYYVEGYKFFSSQGQEDKAASILKQLLDSSFTNHFTLRAMAYQLESEGQLEAANLFYNKIFSLQPQDARSYRELALSNYEVGQFENAYNFFNKLYNKDLMEKFEVSNYQKVQEVSYNDVGKVLMELEDYADKNLKIQYKLRILVDSNRDDVDINLKLIDPNREISSSDHMKTEMGGNFFSMYGLVEYTNSAAQMGAYYLMADYQNKSDKPVYLKLTVFKNYGKPEETQEIKVIRLLPKKKEQILSKIEF